MNIAFTTTINNNWDSYIGSKLGRSSMFLIYNENTDILEVVPNFETETKYNNAGVQTINKLLLFDIDIIITSSEVGNKVFDIAQAKDIKIYICDLNITIKEAYQKYKTNNLVYQNNK